MTDDPLRLRDDPAQPEALRTLLEQASRPIPPDPAGAARLARALGPRVPPGAVGGGVALVVLIGAGTWWAASHTPSDPSEPTVVAAPSVAPPAAPVDELEPTPPEGSPSTPEVIEPAPSVRAPRARAHPCDDEAARLETRLVAEANGLVERDPRGARALLDRLDDEVGDCGFMGVEREGLRILALAGLGRTPEARRRADRFLAAHPEGRLARRIRAALP
jgi:hypothetical protein